MFRRHYISYLIPVLLVLSCSGSSAQTRSTFFELPEGHIFSGTGRQVISLSPDGSQFAYVALNQIFVKGMAEREPRVVVMGEQNVTNPVFSPDGKFIAYWSGATQELKRVPAAGGPSQPIAKAGNPFGLSWGVDDFIVFGQGPAGIQRVRAAGGVPETVIKVGAGEVAHGPQVLPDGDTVLYTLGSTQPASPATLPAALPPAALVQLALGTVWDNASIVAESLKTKQRKVLVQGSDGRYFPGGHLVYAKGGQLMSVPFDAARLEVTGRAVTHAEGVRNAGAATGTTQFTFSANGTLMYLTVANSLQAVQRQLVYIGFDGSVKPIRPVPPSIFGPRVSPDGKQVAYGAEQGVWIADLTSDAPARRITSPLERGGAPVWSPDGDRIAYISILDGNEALFMRKADGSGTEELLSRLARAPEYWSALHQTISYITLDGPAGDMGDYDIWGYSFVEKQERPLLVIPKSAQSGSRLSPDGRWIAYESNETGRAEIYVEPFPRTGVRHQISKTGGSRPIFSPDGTRLFFDNNGGPAVQLFATTIQTQPSFTFTEPAPLPVKGFVQAMGTNRRQWDITPDGRQFVTTINSGLTPARIEIVTDWLKN